MTIYENEQWKVFEDRIESIDPKHAFEIAIDRVFDTKKRGKNVVYDWPIQMAKKDWVDVWSFTDAFDRALHHHAEASGTPVDEDMLFLTKQEAFLMEHARPA